MTENLSTLDDCTIMVVDDDDDIRSAISELLTFDGYKTIEAQNGQDALDKLTNAEPPRLILLDLMMPTMNGWEFLAIHDDDPSIAVIPVVAMTAVPPDLRRDLHVAGAITKPLDLASLMDYVERYCPKQDVSAA